MWKCNISSALRFRSGYSSGSSSSEISPAGYALASFAAKGFTASVAVSAARKSCAHARNSSTVSASSAVSPVRYALLSVLLGAGEKSGAKTSASGE